MSSANLEDRRRAALRQPGAIERTSGNVKFQCPACAAEGHDRHEDNAGLFPDGNWGCAHSPTRGHWNAIGRALGALNGHQPPTPIAVLSPAADRPTPAPSTTAAAELATQPYVFAPAFPPGHFVSDYIGYAAQRTDAAHEYHEAAACLALAAATPNVRASLAQFGRGLGTNLYLLFVGDSTRSRKSTAADYTMDLIDRVIPDGRLAAMTTPEAFVEQLARRNGQSATWCVDEFSGLLDKLEHAKYMAGLRGVMLAVYDGREHKYERHSKRTKQGRTEDVDWIKEPNLSLLGNATPSLFDDLTTKDIQDGLLIRFAVIMPTQTPPRKRFEEMTQETLECQTALARRLSDVFAWATCGPSVQLSRGALDTIDALAMEIETFVGGDTSRAMLQRITPMAVKLAMLAAVGRPDGTATSALAVTTEDAACGVRVARRWMGYNIAFGARVGESAFERQLERCLAVVQARGAVGRRVVARTVHLEKRMLDTIQETLADRGAITVSRVAAASGPDTVVWEMAE